MVTKTKPGITKYHPWSQRVLLAFVCYIQESWHCSSCERPRELRNVINFSSKARPDSFHLQLYVSEKCGSFLHSRTNISHLSTKQHHTLQQQTFLFYVTPPGWYTCNIQHTLYNSYTLTTRCQHAREEHTQKFKQLAGTFARTVRLRKCWDTHTIDGRWLGPSQNSAIEEMLGTHTIGNDSSVIISEHPWPLNTFVFPCLSPALAQLDHFSWFSLCFPRSMVQSLFPSFDLFLCSLGSVSLCLPVSRPRSISSYVLSRS